MKRNSIEVDDVLWNGCAGCVAGCAGFFFQVQPQASIVFFRTFSLGRIWVFPSQAGRRSLLQKIKSLHNHLHDYEGNEPFCCQKVGEVDNKPLCTILSKTRRRL